MTDSFGVRDDAFSDDSLTLEPQGLEGVSTPPQGPNPYELLGLAPELLQAINDLGYTTPTPVQIKTIPLALAAEPTDGKTKSQLVDLMVSSQTGSGKTAAFLLPVLHTMLRRSLNN